MVDISTCECWFLDVGQGYSNVILLGDRRAIVIDCGPKGAIQTLQLLKTWADYIEALVITHNDEDHDYNVASVLEAYPGKAVRRILFLQDRPAKNIETYRTVGLLRSKLKEDYPRPERLEACGATPKVLFSEGDVTLAVIYPDYTASMEAESAGSRRANVTSAVLRLAYGNRSVVFSGDATFEAWEMIHSELADQRPLTCDVITVPHHGGRISGRPNNEAQMQEKLYRDIIHPQYGIVSVGTANRDGHPFSETIQALKSVGVKVLCTQMTKKCCDDLESVRSLRRMLVQPSRSTRKIDTTAGGKSRNVACHSTIVTEVGSDTVKFAHMPSYIRDLQACTGIDGFHGRCLATN